jgi:hypothetical protein
MFACGCKPGTYEDGWQEVKSPACREIELQAWRDAIARYEANRGKVTRLPPSNIGPITLFVRIDGKLRTLRSE